MSSDMRAPAPPQSGFDDNVYQRLLRERIVFLGSEVRDENANAICAQMLLLAAEDPEKDIYLYINSPGGSVTAGMAIYDTMQFVGNDVATVATGLAASMGQFLLAAGAKGKRFALPHARVLIHQPYAGAQGQVSDIELASQEIQRLKTALEEILAEHTGQDVDKIHTDTDRDFVMTATEAVEYGIIDEVIMARDSVDTSGPIKAVGS